MSDEIKSQEELDDMTPELLEEYQKEVEQEDVKPEEDKEDETIKIQLEEEIESEDEEKEDSETTQDSDEETEEVKSENDKKFEGKTKEEVEEAYRNQEELLKRQAEELGQSRKMAEKMKELEDKIAEMGKPEKEETVQDEIKFDPEKYNELLVDDPVAAQQYLRDYEIIPTVKEILNETENERIERENKETAELKQQESLKKQGESFNEFFEMDEFKDMDDKESEKFGAFLRENVRLPKDGYFSKDALVKAYGWFNPEKKIIEAKKQTLKDVEDAAPDVETLGGQGKRGKTITLPKDGTPEDYADYAEENLSVEQMDELIDKME